MKKRPLFQTSSASALLRLGKTMVRDTLDSQSLLPAALDAVRTPAELPPTALQLESTIRTPLDPDEAYNDIPGEAPQYC